jgi:hypothetical protein
VAGGWPAALDAGALERALGTSIAVEWRGLSGGRDPLANEPRLGISTGDAERVAVAVAGEAPVDVWPGVIEQAVAERLDALTTVDALGAAPPSIEELRLFRATLGRVLSALERGEEPSSWTRVAAGRLGLRFARVGADGSAVWALHEPPSTTRRGHPTLVVRPGAASGPLVVEVPAPRWEIGSSAAGGALFRALSARAWLLAGALPDADPTGAMDPRRIEGRHGYFQLAHEVWLGRGAHTLSVQGIAPERAPPEDAVLSTGRELLPGDEEPAWLAPVRASLASVGCSVARLDGARAHAAFGGGGDPTLAFAEKFADGQHALLWLAPRVRRIVSHGNFLR